MPEANGRLANAVLYEVMRSTSLSLALESSLLHEITNCLRQPES